MTSSHILVMCIYAICSPTSSLAVDATPNLDSFDKLVRQLMNSRRIPGLVVTAVDLRRQSSDGVDPRDPVDVERQYGWADIDARRAMTTDTRVCIASLTKAFTSTLLGIMLQNTTRNTIRQVLFSESGWCLAFTYPFDSKYRRKNNKVKV